MFTKRRFTPLGYTVWRHHLIPSRTLSRKQVTCEAYFSKRESFLSMVLCLNKIRFVKVQGYFQCLPKVDG